jgi:non-ribosomal peptide synthetase component F
MTRLGRQVGATEFMVVLALMAVWLSSYTDQADILIGTPITNRDRLETEGLIGLFLNTLIFRHTVDRDRSFAAFLEGVRDNALDAYAHQALPFERLVDELRIPRDASRNPLFQAMLNLESVATPPPDLPRVRADGLGTSFVRSRVDLHLGVRPRPDGLGLSLIYNTDLFRPATAAAMLTALVELTRLAVEAPQTSIGDLIRGVRQFAQEDVVQRRRDRTQQHLDRLRSTRRLAAVSEAREGGV